MINSHSGVCSFWIGFYMIKFRLLIDIICLSLPSFVNASFVWQIAPCELCESRILQFRGSESFKHLRRSSECDFFDLNLSLKHEIIIKKKKKVWSMRLISMYFVTSPIGLSFVILGGISVLSIRIRWVVNTGMWCILGLIVYTLHRDNF